MKIGILTFHNAINYGAVLQVYALKKTLEKNGADVSVINYHNEKVTKMAKIRKLENKFKLKKYIKYQLLDVPFNKKVKKFGTFSEKHLQLNKKPLGKADLKMLNNEFDKFVVGSDQVWNFKITGSDQTYLLDFVDDNQKKMSYAASIGLTEIQKGDISYYDTYLEQIQNISVREQEAIKIIQSNRLVSDPSKVKVVLDPTFLLDKNEWNTQFNLAKDTNEKYLLVYAFLDYKYLKDVVKKIAKEKGLKILWITASLEYDLQIKYIRDASPEKFLELFYNASYIITNSFHGTAFAINFNKEFNVELLVKNSKVNSRMVNILRLVGLENRLVTSDVNYETNEIDYSKVNQHLAKERQQSLMFITNSMSSDIL